MTVLTCHSCHHSWPIDPPIARSEECPGCRRDGKVCLNCRFYSASAYRECLESEASWVKVKDKGNFCDYFEPAPAAGMAKASTKDDAAAKLDALFGGLKKDAEPKPAASLEDELAKFLKNKS